MPRQFCLLVFPCKFVLKSFSLVQFRGVLRFIRPHCFNLLFNRYLIIYNISWIIRQFRTAEMLSWYENLSNARNICFYSISQEICTRFLLCCALLWLYIDWFSHIHQAYFTGTSKATLMNMDRYFMWIHYERLHNHNKAKHNKTVCIFLGIYCTDDPSIDFRFQEVITRGNTRYSFKYSTVVWYHKVISVHWINWHIISV